MVKEKRKFNLDSNLRVTFGFEILIKMRKLGIPFWVTMVVGKCKNDHVISISNKVV